jgi:hypothetical protein
MPCQPFRLPGDLREDLLGHILSGVNVAVHQPQGCGINQIYMPPGQFGKGSLRPLRGIPAEQLGVFVHYIS